MEWLMIAGVGFLSVSEPSPVLSAVDALLTSARLLLLCLPFGGDLGVWFFLVLFCVVVVLLKAALRQLMHTNGSIELYL